MPSTSSSPLPSFITAQVFRTPLVALSGLASTPSPKPTLDPSLTAPPTTPIPSFLHPPDHRRPGTLPGGWVGWGGVGWVLGQVSDRDTQHHPSTRNATRVTKGGWNYTFCPILMKHRGRITIFSSFLLNYRGRNYTIFPETWKRGV